MRKGKQSGALRWILAEAKRLRTRDGNRRQWKQYVKQASAIYAEKHQGKSPIGKPRKRKGKGSVSGVTTRSKTNSIGSINHHISVARKGVESQLKDKLLLQYKAGTKTQKKKIGKDIAKLKSQLKRLTIKK